MPLKVTDPAKIVTDELVLRQLVRLGIDKDYVELWHDYAHRDLGKEYNPYAKFYRDTRTDSKIMSVSGLPMVNADGDKICGNAHNETKVGWELKATKYVTKPNIFAATIDGPGVELLASNDQPWGAKKGDSASWEPRLFLNGAEQYPTGGVTLLPTDPINQNYHENVLEWNYGICKRRIKVIEGRFRERWIFPANPNGDVRIKHHLVGSLKVRIGYALDANGNPLEIIVTDDEELIPAASFAKAVYPVEIGASETFYPDAHEETSSVDGFVMDQGIPSATWSELRNGAGLSSNDISAFANCIRIESYSLTNKWLILYRGIFLFDTSGLPDGCTIEDPSTLSLYGMGKGDNTLAWYPNINIYSSAPASNTALAAGDYDSLGTTAFSSPITYAGWSTTGYNDFSLNTAGKNNISKTDVSKFGARNAGYDVANSAPTPWMPNCSAFLSTNFAEKGAGFKPKLVVTYTTGWTGKISGVTNPAKIMGIDKANIAKVKGVA